MLCLDGTKVSDSGMAHLQGLNNLESLSLIGTEVADNGLARLKSLVSLKTLELRGTLAPSPVGSGGPGNGTITEVARHPPFGPRR
jgi:hypothetical protein